NYGFKNFRALIQKFLPKMKKFEEEREKNIYFLVKKDYESYY
ncbi:TPA: NYN domain-containing protein, partial [Campylobacter jejuni]